MNEFTQGLTDNILRIQVLDTHGTKSIFTVNNLTFMVGTNMLGEVSVVLISPNNPHIWMDYSETTWTEATNITWNGLFKSVAKRSVFDTDGILTKDMWSNYINNWKIDGDYTNNEDSVYKFNSFVDNSGIKVFTLKYRDTVADVSYIFLLTINQDVNGYTYLDIDTNSLTEYVEARQSLINDTNTALADVEYLNNPYTVVNYITQEDYDNNINICDNDITINPKYRGVYKIVKDNKTGEELESLLIEPNDSNEQGFVCQ